MIDNLTSRITINCHKRNSYHFRNSFSCVPCVILWYALLRVAGVILWYALLRGGYEIFRDPSAMKFADNNVILPYHTYTYSVEACNSAGCVDSSQVSYSYSIHANLRLNLSLI